LTAEVSKQHGQPQPAKATFAAMAVTGRYEPCASGLFEESLAAAGMLAVFTGALRQLSNSSVRER
jgi:hypothetical protein